MSVIGTSKVLAYKKKKITNNNSAFIYFFIMLHWYFITRVIVDNPNGTNQEAENNVLTVPLYFSNNFIEQGNSWFYLTYISVVLLKILRDFVSDMENFKFYIQMAIYKV